jgi:hypothetical protein
MQREPVTGPVTVLILLEADTFGNDPAGFDGNVVLQRTIIVLDFVLSQYSTDG